MPAAEQIVIHLRPEALEVVRTRIASGEFSSESEAINELVLDSILPRYDGPGDAFLRECAERYDRARKDPSTLLTLDEAFAGLDEE